MGARRWDRHRQPLDRTRREHLGDVAEVRFFDPEEGSVIATLRDGFAIKGRLPEREELTVGQRYRFLGRWEEDQKWGPQFRFDSCIKDLPLTRDGVCKYLAKHVEDVGEKKAAKLYDHYGNDTLKVLREDTERVLTDGLLTREVAQAAAEFLLSQAATATTTVDLFGIFSGRGFPGKLIDECIARWGVRAPAMVRRNPFALLLAKMPGCGFKRCDRLWCDLTKRPAALKRQALAAWDAVRRSGDGHTWHSGPAVIKAAREAVGAGADPERAVMLAVRGRLLAYKRDERGQLWLSMMQHARDEVRLATHVRRLRKVGATLWPHLYNGPDGSHLPSDHQSHAWNTVSKVSALAMLIGGPGTGKTFVLAHVLRSVIRSLGESNVCVVAPTGKAAVRATESLRAAGVDMTATTIHQRLKIGRNGHDGEGWGFECNENNPLPHRVIVCDEVSMMSVDLLASLLGACQSGTHVLLVGDPGQLPPVGHGAPLRDLLAAGLPRAELTETRRNSGAIVAACHAIRRGEKWSYCDRYDPEAGMNLRHIEAATDVAAADALLAWLPRLKAFDARWECQVITATNNKSAVSRKELNPRLQQLLNPDGYEVKGNPFRAGDKIICTRNGLIKEAVPVAKTLTPEMARDPGYYQESPTKKEVYVANGELGRVVAVASNLMIAAMGEAGALVRVPIGKQKDDGDGDNDGDDADRSGGRGCNFDLAYAVTCHKMQGSQAPCVIVMIDEAGGRIASREFHYTGLSRASKLCVTIGPRHVIERQAKRETLSRRKTFLREQLS